ncbi:MAG: site-specific integrase [Clostridia bacterium]|nr:site-specific integrase [Clostridia bacterium]
MSRRGENIYKRKDGRYEGRYIKKYDLSGKAVYGYVYSRTYADIKEKLVKCKTEKRILHMNSDMLLSEWLDEWLETQLTLKPTTKHIYKSYIKNHIVPALGNVRLRKLNTEILQKFVNGLKLASSTKKAVFCTLLSALSAAEDRDLITNVWSKVKTPKKERPAVRILSSREQQKLEKFLTDDEDIGILICLYTGLRIGELCALKWENINFETSVLSVRGTQARIGSNVEIISPKSKTSKREIPIPSFLLDRINKIPRDCEFVVSKNKKPFDIRTYRRHFKKVLRRAGLPDIKFHSLRHLFATRALEVGMDYKTLSEILGHSSVAITLDLYAHSLSEHKKNEMDKLSLIFNS